jgi:hypothetical protein
VFHVDIIGALHRKQLTLTLVVLVVACCLAVEQFRTQLFLSFALTQNSSSRVHD